MSGVIKAVLWTLLFLTACTKLLPDEVLHEQYESSPERMKLHQLAEHGNAEAQYRLGSSYCCGLGKGYHNEKAFNWFCQAAKRGHSQAMFEVAQMYAHHHRQRGMDWVTFSNEPARGYYPKRDVVRAYVWYSVAETMAGGHSQAAIQKNTLIPEMTIDSTEAANQLIANWREVPCGTGPMPWDDTMEYYVDPPKFPEKRP